MSQESNFFQIEIPKRATNCMSGHELLSPGMEYYSILLSDKRQGYQRNDFCKSCWESVVKDQFHSLAKTAWKAKVIPNKEKVDLAKKTRDEKALYLLKEAVSQTGKRDWAETFVLALYLARRRILTLRQEIAQEDGSLLCIYEVVDTEEMLPVRRESLLKINVEQVQKNLESILS